MMRTIKYLHKDGILWKKKMAAEIILSKADIKILLNLMDATTFQGKAGAHQYLRIYQALESALDDNEE